MKKSVYVALAVAAATMAGALCFTNNAMAFSLFSKSEKTAEKDANKPLKIAFFMYENSNTFTTYIRKGMENYGATKNVVVTSFDGRSDQATQTDSITTVIAKGQYDIIVVNPVDSGAGTTINNMCRDSNMPVIYADRAPDLISGVLNEYDKSYYVGLDWSEPGAVQAEMVYSDWKADRARLDKNGDGVLQYVLLQGNIAQQNAIFRTAAIHELFAKWAADGTMKTQELDVQDGNWSSDKGKDIMDVWNVKFGNQIEAVLCNNDTMAMGAIESLKTAGAFDEANVPEVYGINGIPDVWEMIEQGYMSGCVLTSPYREAVAIIDMAINICAGKDPLEGTDLKWGEFGKDVRISNSPIRKENIDEAKTDYSNCL